MPIAGFFFVERPALQSLLNLQIVPEFAQGVGQLRAGRLKFILAELRGEIFKRRQDFLAQPLGKFVRQRFAPFFAAPAEFERGVFKPVNVGFLHGTKSGFERGEPIIVPPVECDGAQCAAGQLGQRVMRDEFAAVEEKRDFVAAENPRERFVIILQIADKDGAIAEPIPGADEFQNFARGENGLGFGIGAGAN